jgi:4-amino-4-deoxy-L-arabinose transferase-like glycosyltransferase
MPSRTWAGVAALTLLAFVLRLVQLLDQSLFADELFLYAIVAHHDLGHVLSAVHDSESTPPLHFVLAWASGQVGDPTTWVRVPSLLAGTATVPATFLLGRRTVGERAGLIAAAVLAIAPFTLLYGVEARAYALLGLLSVLSTLALLRALESRRRAWWIVFGALTLAILYTHYAGVFVVAAQGAWGAWRHRDRLRELALTYAAVAVGYAPWIPSFVFQSHDSAANRIEDIYPLSVESAFRGVLQVVPGHPFFPLRELPGRPAVVVLVAVVATAAALALFRALRAPGDDGGPAAPTRIDLLAILALATPLGALLYSLGPQSVYLPRNLIASLPAAALLLGAAIARAGRIPAIALAAGLLAVLAFGAAKTLEAKFKRPPYRQAADYIERRAGPGDAVVELAIYSRPPLGLSPYLDDDRLPLSRFRPARPLPPPPGGPRARVFLLVPQAGVLRGTPRLRELRGFQLVSAHYFRGGGPLGLFEYRPRRG